MRCTSITSWRRAGRLVPSSAEALRARAVLLCRGQAMDWHSTADREECLIGLSGRLDVEIRLARARVRRLRLVGGRALFLPRETLHRVINRSTTRAHYLYVTAPIPGKRTQRLRNA